MRLIYISFIAFLFACSTHPREAPKVVGINFSALEGDAGSNMDKLETILENNPNLKLIHRLDRPELGYSLIYFGNPKLGSPLMIKSQYTGLDLPQRMLIFNDNSGGSFVCYNSMRYLNSAYGLEDHPNLEKAKNGLQKLVTALAEEEPHLVQNARFGRNKGIRKLNSPLNFRDSYQLIFEKVSEEGYKVEKP